MILRVFNSDAYAVQTRWNLNKVLIPPKTALRYSNVTILMYNKANFALHILSCQSHQFYLKREIGRHYTECSGVELVAFQDYFCLHLVELLQNCSQAADSSQRIWEQSWSFKPYEKIEEIHFVLFWSFIERLCSQQPWVFIESNLALRPHLRLRKQPRGHKNWQVGTAE